MRLGLVVAVAQAFAGDPRVATVEEYFDGLTGRFVPSAALGVDAVVVWDVVGRGSWHAVIRGGELVVARGGAATPDLVMHIGAEDLVGLANGDADGTRLYLLRRLTVDGSLDLAVRLKDILPPAR